MQHPENEVRRGGQVPAAFPPSPDAKNWAYASEPYPVDQQAYIQPQQWTTANNGNAVPAAAQPHRYPVLKVWKWEILQLLLAAGLLIAITVILLHFENRQVPQWPLSINLTTIVSLLSTVFRAIIAASAAEILAQVKWARFTSPRSLFDLQRYDRASRGTVGAARLLLAVPGSVIGTAAALVTILALAVGPFTQQSIRNIPCQITASDMTASVPAANWVQGSWIRVAAGEYEPYVDVQGALVNGLALPTANDSLIAASCPTGNCTWPTYNGVSYSTVGLCSQCFDSSANLESPGTLHNLSLPGGAFIDSQTVLTVTADELGWVTSFPQQVSDVLGAALVNVTVLAYTENSCDQSPGFQSCSTNPGVTAGDMNNLRPLAVSCAVYTCVRSYESWVANGQLQENLVSTTPIFQSNETDVGDLDRNYTAVQTPCAIDGKLYDTGNFSLVPSNHSFATFQDASGANVTAPFECVYEMNGLFGMTLSQWSAGTLFNGSCGVSLNGPDVYCVGAHSSFWLQPFFSGGAANLTTVVGIMDGFTAAATTKLREIGGSNYIYNNVTGPDDPLVPLPGLAMGVVYANTVCTQFDWYWLLLPAALVVVTTLLLVAVIASSYADRSRPVWKSSLLPLLFHGLIEPAPSWRPLDEDELSRAARATEVRFQSAGGPVGFRRSSAGPAEVQQQQQQQAWQREAYYDQAVS